MTTSHRLSPLPRHTLGATAIPAAAAHTRERETDRYHIGHVLAGLMALGPDSAGTETHCLGYQLGQEQEEPMPDDEVTRLLILAESEQPDVDAWNIVTLTRPRGATEAEWQVFAAYGPMRLDEAHKFLATLAGKVISVQSQSDFPILESLNLPPAEVMRASDDSLLPRATALVTQLNREYGSEYTRLLSLAVQDSANGYHHSYMAGLDAAVDALTEVAGGDRPRCKALAINHVGLFLTETLADARTASHGGAVPDMPSPTYGRSKVERS